MHNEARLVDGRVWGSFVVLTASQPPEEVDYPDPPLLGSITYQWQGRLFIGVLSDCEEARRAYQAYAREHDVAFLIAKIEQSPDGAAMTGRIVILMTAADLERVGGISALQWEITSLVSNQRSENFHTQLEQSQLLSPMEMEQ